MKRRFAGLSDPGLVRAVNQDDYYIDPGGRFFIVADGMGGHAGGQEASQIAIRQIQGYLNQCWEAPHSSEVLLKEALERANEGIIEDQSLHPERADMGTTAVMVVFRHEQSWCAHVGDSRLYRLRQTQLEQLTADDTWIGQAILAGEMLPQQAKTHPWRHVLSKCLGRPDLEQASIQKIDLEPGDRLLLCSDGLTEEVPDESICASLQTGSCEQAATDLVEKAKAAGGSDNITVVIVAQD